MMYIQKRAGSLSSCSRASQQNCRSQLAAHSLSSVVLPEPADAEMTWEPGGYLETTELPVDGWGNQFIYETFPGGERQFQIRSMGPDGEEGTEDDLLSTDAY